MIGEKMKGETFVEKCVKGDEIIHFSIRRLIQSPDSLFNFSKLITYINKLEKTNRLHFHLPVGQRLADFKYE